jgi:uncharacterized cupin superfamily protein
MASHPNLVHLDDVPARELDQGEMGWRRKRPGAAAGAVRSGLSLFELLPGRRSTPPHIHANEEEIFFVLGGSGLSWQDGRTHEVRRGDCIVHRVKAEAHTLIAGDDGLQVLAFADNSTADVTYMPHTKMFWAGARWIPADRPHPFAADAEAGPIAVPAPEAARPATIVHVDHVEPEVDATEGFRGAERRLGRAAGAQRTGLRHVVLEPRQASCPPHWHTVEEEIFVVLDGTGEALLGEERLPLRAGSVLVRPPGTRVAHALLAGDAGMTYLAWGHDRPDEIVYYPRSRKLDVAGLLLRVDEVGYYDGEPPLDPPS